MKHDNRTVVVLLWHHSSYSIDFRRLVLTLEYVESRNIFFFVISDVPIGVPKLYLATCCTELYSDDRRRCHAVPKKKGFKGKHQNKTKNGC